MKKRFFALLLSLLALCTLSAQAAGSMENFAAQRDYDGRFTDVSSSAWYYDNVVCLYEMGLTNGQSDTSFGPGASVSIEEVLAFAARLHSLYLYGDAEAGPKAHQSDGAPWYQSYWDYLKSANVIDDTFSVTPGNPATRAQVAGVIGNVLPSSEFTALNDTAVTLGYALRAYITDVTDYTPYQKEILQLYRWGIVTGSDSQGSYYPDRPITRGELTALLTRLADPSLRVTLPWDVSAYYTAKSTTYRDLVTPGTLRPSHSADDLTAIDSNLRYMLSRGEHILSLQLEKNEVTEANIKALMDNYLTSIRHYLEQGYNAVNCTYSASTGRVTLRFYSSIFSDTLLSSARSDTLQSAIAAHDQLWQEGKITAGMSEYEKAKVYYTWICENCVYDYRANESSVAHTAYSLFCMGNAVCDGYTAAYNLLLKLEGIQCTTQSTPDHIWTVATLDGKTYHIDTTWGDQTGSIRYEYFGMTEKDAMARFQ